MTRGRFAACVATLVSAAMVAGGLPALPSATAAVPQVRPVTARAVQPQAASPISFVQPLDTGLVRSSLPQDASQVMSVGDTASADLNADGNPDLVASVHKWPDGQLVVLLGNGDGTFAPPDVYGMGTETANEDPAGIALGDFDGNGTVDVATTVFIRSRQILVFPNDGSGALGAPVSTPMVRQDSELLTADLNGDGALDLLGVDVGASVASTYLGNDDGTFDAPVERATAGQPRMPVLADFDGDGDLDFALTNWAEQGLQVFLGAGDGTFGAPTTVAIGPNSTQLAAGDVTGDGIVDLVAVANWGPSGVCGTCLVTLTGVGDGTFVKPPESPTDPRWRGLPFFADWGAFQGSGLADVDDDGDLDWAVVNRATLVLARNDGAGGWSLSTWISSPGVPEGYVPTTTNADERVSYEVDFDDFNGDGVIDVVTPSANQNIGLDGGIYLTLGDGERPGRLLAAEVTLDPDGWSEEDTLALGDWDGDGLPDLLGKRGGGSIGYFPGRGDGTFGAKVAIGATCFNRQFRWEDFDGDGSLDVVCPVSQSVLRLYYGDGDGSPAASVDLDPAYENDIRSVTVGDVDGDGALDLVEGQSWGFGGTGARTTTFLNGGAGRTWSAPIARDVGGGFSNSSIALGDFDEDGETDWVGHRNSQLAGFGGDNDVLFAAGNGDGTFAVPTETTFFANHFSLEHTQTADLDHDGHLDLVANSPFGPIFVFLGNGDGTFDPPVTYGSTVLYDLRMADLDRDGELDVLAGHWQAGLSVFRGQGDGTFGAQQYFSVGKPNGLAVAAGDVNGDDRPDAVVRRSDGFVVTFINGRAAAGGGSTARPDLEVTDVSASPTFSFLLY